MNNLIFLCFNIVKRVSLQNDLIFSDIHKCGRVCPNVRLVNVIYLKLDIIWFVLLVIWIFFFFHDNFKPIYSTIFRSAVMYSVIVNYIKIYCTMHQMYIWISQIFPGYTWNPCNRLFRLQVLASTTATRPRNMKRNWFRLVATVFIRLYLVMENWQQHSFTGK